MWQELRPVPASPTGGTGSRRALLITDVGRRAGPGDVKGRGILNALLQTDRLPRKKVVQKRGGTVRTKGLKHLSVQRASSWMCCCGRASAQRGVAVAVGLEYTPKVCISKSPRQQTSLPVVPGNSLDQVHPVLRALLTDTLLIGQCRAPRSVHNLRRFVWTAHALTFNAR